MLFDPIDVTCPEQGDAWGQSGLVVARGWGGQWEMTVLWNQKVVIIIQLYEPTENH